MSTKNNFIKDIENHKQKITDLINKVLRITDKYSGCPCNKYISDLVKVQNSINKVLIKELKKIMKDQQNNTNSLSHSHSLSHTQTLSHVLEKGNEDHDIDDYRHDNQKRSSKKYNTLDKNQSKEYLKLMNTKYDDIPATKLRNRSKSLSEHNIINGRIYTNDDSLNGEQLKSIIKKNKVRFD